MKVLGLSRERANVHIWLSWLVLTHAILIPFFIEFPGLPFRLTTTDLLGVAVLGAWALANGTDGLRSLHEVPAFWASVALVLAHWVALLAAQDLVSGLKEVVKLTSILAFYAVLAGMTLRPADRSRLTWALLLGAVIVSLIAIVESIGKPLGWGYLEHRAAGTMGHANTLGGYLAALSPVGWGLLWTEMETRRRPWVLFLIFGILLCMGTALLLTLSRAAWLSFGVAIAVTTWGLLRAKRRGPARRTWAVAGLGVMVVAVIVLGIAAWTSQTGNLIGSLVVQRLLATNPLSSFGDRERVALMEAAWGMFLDHPWLGVGPGNFPSYVQQYTTFQPAWRHEFPHNVVLHVAAEAGVIGLLSFLWWTGSIIALGYRRVVRATHAAGGFSPGLTVGAFAGAVSVFVGSLFGYPFVHGTWEPFVYCLALTMAAQLGGGDDS